MVKRRATQIRRRGKGRRGTMRRQRGGGEIDCDSIVPSYLIVNNAGVMGSIAYAGLPEVIELVKRYEPQLLMNWRNPPASFIGEYNTLVGTLARKRIKGIPKILNEFIIYRTREGVMTPPSLQEIFSPLVTAVGNACRLVKSVSDEAAKKENAIERILREIPFKYPEPKIIYDRKLSGLNAKSQVILQNKYHKLHYDKLESAKEKHLERYAALEDEPGPYTEQLEKLRALRRRQALLAVPTPTPTPIKPSTFTVSGTAGVSMKPKPSLSVGTARGANVPPISTTPTNPFNMYNVGKALPPTPSNPFNTFNSGSPLPTPARPAPKPSKPLWTANAKERARTAARTKGIPVSANLIHMPNIVGNPPILPNDNWNAPPAVPITANLVPSAGAGRR